MAENAAMTMTQKIIAIAVTIIIISTVAIPVIGDLQNQQYSIVQNTDSRYSSLDTPTFSIEVSNSVVSLDGTNVDDIVGSQPLYIATDKFFIRSLLSSDTHSSVSVFGPLAGSPDYSITVKSIVSDNGSVTITDTSNNEYTATISWAFVPNSNGNYGMFEPNNSRTLYIDADADVILVNALTSSQMVTYGKFTELNILFKLTSGTMVTTGTFTAVPTEHITEGGDYYVYNGQNGVNAVFAPLSYHVLNDDNKGLFNLIGIIPIILILVPVMIAVRMITLRRN